ncbi:MAG: hypothetical protein PWQ31_1304 [Eubacteriales bacterium]|nr:hypothetical protein [Eubacteriales bacterium]
MEVLISPLGTSPGLLYSALAHVQPQRLIVITSELAAQRLPEILSRAGFTGTWMAVCVQDPFTCFHEVDKVWRQIILSFPPWEDGRFTVNITGGTTALQYVVQKVAARLKEEGYAVREMALVDRRSREEQEKEPYVVGECYFLEA